MGRRSPERIEGVLSQVLDTSLALSGRGRSAGTAQSSPVPYDLRYVNASVDLAALVPSLEPSARA